MLEFRHATLTLPQKRTLVFVNVLINMFQSGLLDLFKNLQGNLDKIYVRHRELDDLPPFSPGINVLSTEIRNLVKQSPSLKLVFLCPTAKDALLRFGTWLTALLNNLDN